MTSARSLNSEHVAASTPIVQRPTTFMIVDDHPVVSFALKHLLQGQQGWRVAHHANTPETAAPLLNSGGVDCVLVDLLFPGQCGLDFLRWMRINHPRVVSIVYSVQPENAYARRCLQAGASGYVSKHADVESLLETVRLALAGHTAVSGRVLTEGVRGYLASESSTAVDQLSIRELEVLQLIGLGYNNRKIATVLCRSAKTIESHRYRLSRKLGIPNGPELLHFALQHRQAVEGMPVKLDAGEPRNANNGRMLA